MPAVAEQPELSNPPRQCRDRTLPTRPCRDGHSGIAPDRHRRSDNLSPIPLYSLHLLFIRRSGLPAWLVANLPRSRQQRSISHREVTVKGEIWSCSPFPLHHHFPLPIFTTTFHHHFHRFFITTFTFPLCLPSIPISIPSVGQPSSVTPTSPVPPSSSRLQSVVRKRSALRPHLHSSYLYSLIFFLFFPIFSYFYHIPFLACPSPLFSFLLFPLARAGQMAGKKTIAS